MKLKRICKDGNSIGEGQCAAVYAVEDDPLLMVGQGRVLDPDITAQLLDLAVDEAAVVIPTETVLRAAASYLADHGHQSAATDVETFLRRQGVEAP